MNKAGEWGENKACEYLRRKGYTILHRNFRGLLEGKIIGEIDIIAQDGETAVFVEVKTRVSALFGTGAEAVNRRKQEKLRRTAMLFDPGERLPWRPDIIDILYAGCPGNWEIVSLKHIINAF